MPWHMRRILSQLSPLLALALAVIVAFSLGCIYVGGILGIAFGAITTILAIKRVKTTRARDGQ